MTWCPSCLQKATLNGSHAAKHTRMQPLHVNNTWLLFLYRNSYLYRTFFIIKKKIQSIYKSSKKNMWKQIGPSTRQKTIWANPIPTHPSISNNQLEKRGFASLKKQKKTLPSAVIHILTHIPGPSSQLKGCSVATFSKFRMAIIQNHRKNPSIIWPSASRLFAFLKEIN